MRCDEQRTRATATALISSGRVVPALDMDPATEAFCLRLHEPARTGGDWAVELLAQDREQPSLVVGLPELWAGTSLFGPGAIQEVLAALARMARLAPELAAALDAPVPDRVTLDDRAVLAVLRERAAVLEDAGIVVLLPSWWTAPARLGLRARACSSAKAGGSAVPGGLGIDALVEFEWEAALGGRKLTKAEQTSLARAAATRGRGFRRRFRCRSREVWPRRANGVPWPRRGGPAGSSRCSSRTVWAPECSAVGVTPGSGR